MVSPVYIRPLLALLVMAVIIGVVAVVLRNDPRGGAEVRSENQQLPHNIDVALKNARFSEIQDGLVVWELSADRVDYDKGGDTAFLEVIRMEFQRSGSNGTVTVTADKGEYLNAAKTVRLNGHVRGVTEDGVTFNTGSIVYTGAKDLFSTADRVTFRQQRLQLTALGMDLGVKNQRARFHSAVDAAINLN